MVDLDDIKFHGCVRLNRFEVDRSITFCPPGPTSKMSKSAGKVWLRLHPSRGWKS